ncbi:TonB-dependent receptor [Sphingomonas ginsenosidivorax]|nr:TonB-dependent receptor [Sphingomonas ginsenosidivorax]
MTKRAKYLLMSVSSCPLLSASVAGAQTASPPAVVTAPGASEAPAANAPAATTSAQSADQGGVQDIIVTAQKRQETANRVGMSITAASGDDLKLRGITSAIDLVKIVPGFNFTQSNYGAPVYSLRGVGYYDTSLGAPPAVSVYVDEVLLPFSIMSIGATLDLERVEVLKGPQGTLFGANSTGGAVNYIAAKPTSTFKAGFDATYGNFNRLNVGGFVSGPISDTLKARISFSNEHSGDWQYSYTHDAKRGKSDVFMGRVLLDWTPSDRLKVRINVNGYTDRSDNQAAQLVAVLPSAPAVVKAQPLPPGNNRAADWDDLDPYRRKADFLQASVRVDYDINDAMQLTSITAYDTFDRDSVTSADGTRVQNFAAATPGSSRDFGQELRLSGDIDRVRYVLGGSYSYDNVKDSANALADVSSLPFKKSIGTANQKVNTAAIFGNLDYRFTDTLTLQGGVRYTDLHRKFNGCLYDSGAGDLAATQSAAASRLLGRPVVFPAGSCVTLGPDFLPILDREKLNEDNVSWRAAINWQVTPRALLYANVSHGYKSGAFPVANATNYLQFAAAIQEDVIAYEAGFKLTAFNRTLQLNGAGFYYDYRNKQLRGRRIDEIFGSLNVLVNVPKSSITGGEIQATLRPAKGLTISAGATYVDSKIRGDFLNYDALSQFGNFSGEALPLTPKWQATGDGQYEFALSSEMRAFVGGSINHQGATHAGLGTNPLFAIPSYTLLDARVGIETPDDRWRLVAFVRNITDKYYWTNTFQSGPNVVIKYTGQPRTFGATLSYRY